MSSMVNGWAHAVNGQRCQPQVLQQSDFTADLNYYFNNQVQLHREEIKKSVASTLPIVRDILDYIHSQDPRFNSEGVYVGSYWSGLKVESPDEFDISVPLNIPETFSWGPSEQCYFNVSPYDASKLIRTDVPLPEPPTGYTRPKYNGNNQTWLNHPSPTLVFDNHLISLYVKNAFKKYLRDAVRALNMRGQVTVSRKEAGPALTIYIQRPGYRDPISVDFAPLLRIGISFPSRVQWPRSGKAWPPREKVEKIMSMGINFTAKRDLEWYYSFAEAEKELTAQMDKEGENTNRKKLHRIMKKLTHDVWCPGQKPVLTSYILKNVLFWECEDFPRPRDWENDAMWERFCSLTNRLQRALSSRQLQLYFYPEVNLLKQEDGAKYDAVIQNIRRFMENPAGFLRQ